MERLPALVLLAVLAGCGGGGEPSSRAVDPPPTSVPVATPMPRVVQPADDGEVFALEVGGTATLRIRQEGPEPAVTGKAVLLVRQVGVTGSGARQWEVRAVAEGTSTISATDPRFTFTVVVSE